MNQKPAGFANWKKPKTYMRIYHHSFWRMYVGNVTVFYLEKQQAPYNDCFFENIKKNHNDDGVIVWYNVGQSGGNKG